MGKFAALTLFLVVLAVAFGVSGVVLADQSLSEEIRFDTGEDRTIEVAGVDSDTETFHLLALQVEADDDDDAEEDEADDDDDDEDDDESDDEDEADDDDDDEDDEESDDEDEADDDDDEDDEESDDEDEADDDDDDEDDEESDDEDEADDDDDDEDDDESDDEDEADDDDEEDDEERDDEDEADDEDDEDEGDGSVGPKNPTDQTDGKDERERADERRNDDARTEDEDQREDTQTTHTATGTVETTATAPTRVPQQPTVTQTTTTQPPSERFHVSKAILDVTTITAGDTVRITLEVENVGDQDGTFEPQLLVDGQAVASESITLERGESEWIVLEHRFDEPGVYRIAVEDLSLGRINVTSASETAAVRHEADENQTADDVGKTGSVEVLRAVVTADWVTEGSVGTVRATVQNTGDAPANRTIVVTIDGQWAGSETVTLQGNERDVVTIPFEAVSGTVAVDGVEAGRIAVRGLTTAPTATGDRETDGGGFDLGLAGWFALLVYGALVGAAAIEVSRHR